MKLTTTALIALSVSALTAEIAGGGYSAEDLAEAVTAEKESGNRVTAIEALEDAIEDLAETQDEPDTAAEAGHTVAKGKSITSKVGILSAGDEVTAEMLAGGADALSALLKAGHIA
jgi:hypothetical protein